MTVIQTIMNRVKRWFNIPFVRFSCFEVSKPVSVCMCVYVCVLFCRGDMGGPATRAEWLSVWWGATAFHYWPRLVWFAAEFTSLHAENSLLITYSFQSLSNEFMISQCSTRQLWWKLLEKSDTTAGCGAGVSLCVDAVMSCLSQWLVQKENWLNI